MDDSRDSTKLVDMGEILAMQSGDPVHLVQTAGPGAERSFRVLPLQEITLGRADDAEVIIDETSVSRYHARIRYVDRDPRLVDLESTNGTFLNGEQISSEILKTGDQIQIGASVLEVTIGGDPEHRKDSMSQDPKLHRQISRIQEKLDLSGDGVRSAQPQKKILAGRLRDIRLPSLLQILESNQNSGTLVLRRGSELGNVFLVEGSPVHAILGKVRGKKALFRMLAFREGSFELVTPGLVPEEETLSGSLQGFLLDGMREIDEYNEYRKDLPGPHAVLAFSPDRTFFLDRVPPDLFDVLSAVSRHHTVGSVVDECMLSDLTVCKTLLMLLREGIVRVDSE